MQHSKVLSLGSYFPEQIVTNRDLEKIIDTTDEWIADRSGIHARRKIAPGQSNSDMGAIAAKQALKRANVDPMDVDLIIYCTASPDKLLPSTGCIMQPKIGAMNAAAFDLAAACCGWLLGLSVADQYIRSGAYKNILIMGVEALSRVTNWKDRNTCVLFGDGAGCCLLTPREQGESSQIYSPHMKSDGRYEGILDIPAGGSSTSLTKELLEANEHCIHMRGREVFKLAVTALAERSQEALDGAGYSVDDVDWFIPHQANIRIIEVVAKKLNVPKEKILINLDRYGNTSAATIPTVMDEAVEQGKIKRGQLLLLASFGGGLTSAGQLIRW